jgi:RimJ/RimL family protein N-acetyltransferase
VGGLPLVPKRSGTVGSLKGKSSSVAHETIEGDGVVLRPTIDDDLATLRGFFTNPGFYERWGGKALNDEEITAKYLGGRSPAVECFIVEEAGRPVGFVQYHVADDADKGGGMDLALLPIERGRGVGTAVVQAIVEFVKRELGWQRFTVDPDVSNTRGVAFWRKAGFTPVRLVDDEPEREPYWLMEWPQPTS